MAASNVAEAPPRAFDELGRRIVRLALPALGALLLEPIYNITDSAIVGHLGKVPLGGLAIATGALNLVGWTSAFIEMATVSLVAFRRGAGDEAGAGRAAGAAYAWSAVLGVVTAVGVYFVAPALVVLLGGHGAVGHQATTYLRIASIGLLPLLVTYAGIGHLTGLGDTRRPFLVALVSTAVNVLLEAVLVYGAHAGIAGSAWGTVAAQFISAGLFVVVSARAAVRARRPGRSELVRLGRDGVPLTIRTVALSAVLLASTAVAARLGTDQLGGHQIALQVWLLLSLTLDSIAVPAQVFVGEALGRRDAPEARRVGRRTLQFGVVGGVVAGALTASLCWAIPWIFTSNPAVRGQALLALVLCGLMQPLAGLAFVLDGLVLGAGSYRTMQYAMIGALLAFLPLAGATLADHRIGLAGVWLALVCWLAARVVILGRHWARGRCVPGAGAGAPAPAPAEA